MTAITNLYAAYRFPIGGTDLPILVTTHGFATNTIDVPEETLARWAKAGFFVLAVLMRGRGATGGSEDAGGREIQDIIDAVEEVRARFPSVVSADKAAFVGYSGGGGNAFSMASKFPDFFNVLVAYFGIADYGYDTNDGWWYTTPSRQAQLTNWVGDRTADSNPYRARNATEAAINFDGGYLYLYQDDQDTTVPVINTNNIAAAFTAAGLSNYMKSVTTTTDDPRWLHAYADTNPGIKQTESAWMAKINSQAVWTIAASGTVTVIGYIKTKRFEIWLRANGSTVYGLDAAATVVYDTTADSYTVTPLTGAIDVTVTQGAKTGSATNISTETGITVT